MHWFRHVRRLMPDDETRESAGDFHIISSGVSVMRE
jgi:hypothetical protein